MFKKLVVLFMALGLAVSVAACKPAGPNNCQPGDRNCDYTMGSGSDSGSGGGEGGGSGGSE